jgi:hypothetical protein
MNRIVLAAFATVLLSGVLPAGHADAMRFAASPAPGVASTDAALVRQAANICGSNGCGPVQTQRVRPHKKHS